MRRSWRLALSPPVQHLLQLCNDLPLSHFNESLARNPADSFMTGQKLVERFAASEHEIFFFVAML
jgi:hypothetical protein